MFDDPQKTDQNQNNSMLQFPTKADKLSRRAHSIFVYTISIGLLASIFWSTQTELDVVTRGSGKVVPSLQNQFVQHFEGGIVSDIIAYEGKSVEVGDVLMRIENPFSQAEFTKASNQLWSKKAELVRLEAESANIETIVFPSEIQKAIPAIVENEALLFKRRRESHLEQVLILKDQHIRKKLEKEEKRSRLKNMQQEYALVNQRVESLKTLHKSGAASKNELLRNQTTLQQIQTKISDLQHQIPQAEAQLSENLRRQNEADLRFRSDAETDIVTTKRAIEQLSETVTAMRDRKVRTEVKAPISGKVHRLFQTTIGGVVRSGQNLMQLVPSDAPIAIEVRLSPKDRAKVWVDLPAIAKLSAYDYSSFGGIQARVTDISTDTLQDEKGEPYFRVKLEAKIDEAKKDMAIIAGMAAEVDILTGKRTIMNYLLKPVQDIKSKALRES
ncbi:MAG: HlyD family type I secretion periplasmic adaptor subunit [Nitratireductor sp.]